jgi:hypothetical protein
LPEVPEVLGGRAVDLDALGDLESVVISAPSRHR